ncbi:MAG: glycosyltransferase [Actinomycetota bacterium]|nr:glycosyltransferase [Actinomycetota bacterium]
MPSSADVLLVSLGSTAGLRRADDELLGSLRRSGVSAAMVRAARPREVRTLALTDLAWARAARIAAQAGIERARPRALIYSTTTSSLLSAVPGAIRFDAPSAGNRPGRHGLWQRPVEAGRLVRSPLLLPWSVEALEEVPLRHGPALVVPMPAESSGPCEEKRDLAAITYGANPDKKGLDLVLDAWSEAQRPGERLLVAGITADAAARALGPARVATPQVSFTGPLAHDAYRALLRRCRVFLTAPRREDYGIAQLEALADGCQLVTVEAPGPYAALPLARRLDSRLVGDDLGRALRLALDDPRPGYAEQAREELKPWRRSAVDRVVADHLVPRLRAEGGV